MATVYLATDLTLHRDVAVTIFRPERAAVSDRLLRKVTSAANVSPLEILPVRDPGSRGTAGAI